MKKNEFWSIVLLMAISLPMLTSCGGDDDGPSKKEEVYVPKDGESFRTYENGGDDYDYMGHYTFINGGTELKLIETGKYFSYIPQYVEYKSKKYPVTCIGRYACGSRMKDYENIGFYSIDIPESVNTIEEYAFAACHAHKISIPSSVKDIGEYAFERCNGLYDIKISEGISVINSKTFWYCDNLTTFSIPKSVKEIKDYAFAYCSKLASVSIPNSVTSIGKNAFCGSGLTSITIPNSVTIIEEDAFRNCNITSLTIPGSIEMINKYSFRNCELLESVVIENGVKEIRSFAFIGCLKLNCIEIPETVLSIDDYAFDTDKSNKEFGILQRVISKISNPFPINKNSFSETFREYGTLYVPIGTFDKYKTTEGWKEIKNIIELDN